MGKKTVIDLRNSVKGLRVRLNEAEETIEAIKNNQVDALVVDTKRGTQVLTLSGADKPYRLILERMNEGAAILTKEGLILFSNERFAKILKAPVETVTGSSIFKWIDSPDVNASRNFFEKKEENSQIELNIIDGTGNLLPVSISLTYLNLEEYDPIICLVVTDLTLRKRSEEIAAAEKLASSIIEQAAEAMIVCDEKNRIVRASKAAEILAGEDLLYKDFDSVFSFTDKDGDVSLKNLYLHDLPVQTEILFKRKDGKDINLIMVVGSLTGKGDKILGHIVTLTNITKHILKEEKISASLKEKTLLLKEIHHRVKNNLQIVSSLLHLQSSFIKDPAVVELFKESQSRINSMALLHQKLYETKSFSQINVNLYLKDLVSFLCSTYMFNSNKILLNFNKEDIHFSVESAVPFGLIINELVTNCIKHAFIGKQQGTIDISVYSTDKNSFKVSVKDDGVGIPKHIDISKPDSLGLQLVISLVEQLLGKLEVVRRDDGTEIIVSLPVTND